EKGFDKATDDTTDVKEDLRLYQCSNCGAEVVTDKTTTATSCVFCGQPLVLQEQMQGEFKPKLVIPFEVDRKKIEEMYEDYIRSKPFYPEEYSTANVIEKIKAVYLPFWLFDFQSSGSVTATGEIEHTHTTSDWIVTDHDVYQLDRAGTMEFNDIPVIASSKTPKNAMDAIEPYDYSKMVPFNKGYLPGFLAERWDKDQESCHAAAEDRAKNTVEAYLEGTLGAYSHIKVLNWDGQSEMTDGAYSLLPAYVLFMDYENDEDKLIAINGQTGKVAGNIPVDKGKRNGYFIKTFLICWVIFALIGLGIFMVW
ncbi:MAG: hypothetical protein HUJ54_02830, partial [Erysipelotrichaceae bacterium]|nr:hypothetical protein [Erysipelotrichaceae bacterium]